MTFKPMTRGPQKGAPPSLEFIALDRLSVDPAYQRATDGPNSRKIITGMVKSWDWSLCQPLVVSRRMDGGLFILDGQHRHAGAQERGDIAHLPCVVLAGINAEGEAQAFVELNTKRQKLSQADIFNGMLAAGDEHAKKVAILIEESGWRMVRSSSTDKWQPGDLHCAPMLAHQIKLVGDAVVRTALEVLRSAYRKTAVSCSASLLKALISIGRGGLTAKERRQLVDALATLAPTAWVLQAENRRHKAVDLSSSIALVIVIEEAAGLRPAPAAAPPPDQPEQARAGESASRPEAALRIRRQGLVRSVRAARRPRQGVCLQKLVLQNEGGRLR